MSGILGATSTHCGRAAGNSSPNPDGTGCGALDLCATGFHICGGAGEVALRSPTGCDGAAPSGNPLFFATAQGSTGCQICALGNSTDPTVCTGCSCAMDCATTMVTANDVFGCGSLGDAVPNCGPLDRFSNNLCQSLGSPWQCGSDGCNEANAVTKTGPDAGGVLCCAD